MAVAPPSVLEIIYDWSLSRPAWQRDALRRIVVRGALGDADIADLVLLCRKEHGDDSVQVTAKPLEKSDLPANPGAEASISLVAMSDVKGVNQLAANQTLPFSADGITIIYGDNGAGKSGYARVLKKACRARYAGEIMPDAYDPAAPRTATAFVSYASGGKPVQSPVAWQDNDKPHGILSAVNVFDRDCAAVHIRDKNEVAFRPFGLDIPDELASACQRVKDALTKEQAELERARDPVFTKPTWRSDTSSGKILSVLTAGTKTEQLEELAKVSAERRARHKQLCEDLAKDPLKASAEQVLHADGLRQLANALKEASSHAADGALQSLKARAFDALSKRTAASVAAESAFKDAALSGVGGNVWRALWDAARHYAEHAAYPGKPFPTPDDDAVCVLCHQPLTTESRQRLHDFDTFVRADTERQAQTAEKVLAAGKADFERHGIHGFPYASVRRKVALVDPDLGARVLRFLASARCAALGTRPADRREFVGRRGRIGARACRTVRHTLLGHRAGSYGHFRL